MENKVTLSICITSYNRGTLLDTNIKKMLSYAGDDVEFIISDNCSTDNTAEFLKQITDKRVRSYINLENVGFMKNAVSVAMKAKGKYLLRMNERDFVNPRLLPKILQWLNKKEADFYIIDNGYLSEMRDTPVNEYLSYDERVYWLKKTRHPGEIIYKSSEYQKFWKEIDYIQCDDRQLVGFFTQQILRFAEKGVGVYKNNINIIIQPSIIKKKRLGQERKEVFANEPYFLPKVEFRNYGVSQRYIKKYVTPELLDVTLVEYYRISLGFSTFEFFDCVNNELVCQRYGYKPPEKINWFLVHVKCLLLAIKILKRLQLLTNKLMIRLLGVTIKNYGNFVKKYGKY